MNQNEDITLRDYFAAHASNKDINDFIPDFVDDIQKLMKEIGIMPLHPKVGQHLNYTDHDMAKLRRWARYQHADMMLEARK